MVFPWFLIKNPSYFQRDTTRRHAKSTVDMPKGSFPSTCQKTVSVDMPKVYSRRHAKTWLSPSTCQKFVPVDMPKKLFPSTCHKVVPVDMPKKIASVDMPKDVQVDVPKKDCLRRHAKRLSLSTCPASLSLSKSCAWSWSEMLYLFSRERLSEGFF